MVAVLKNSSCFPMNKIFLLKSIYHWKATYELAKDANRKSQNLSLFVEIVENMTEYPYILNATYVLHYNNLYNTEVALRCMDTR